VPEDNVSNYEYDVMNMMLWIWCYEYDVW